MCVLEGGGHNLHMYAFTDSVVIPLQIPALKFSLAQVL